MRDRVGGLDVSLFGGEPEAVLRGRPGELLATRDGAICRATGDGAVWIPSLQRRREGERRFAKLPATLALGRARLAGVPALPLAPRPAGRGRPTARSATRSAARSASCTSPSPTGR